MIKNWLLFSLVLFCFVACQSDATKDPFLKCKFGKPNPIFPAQSDVVDQHSFELKGTEGIERVRLKNGLSVMLIQSGCDYIQQEFQFEVPGNHQDKTSSFWVDQTIQILQMLGSMGPEFMAFAQWAEAIGSKAESIKLAESTTLQPGFFAKIDKIPGTDHAILLLTLSNKP